MGCKTASDAPGAPLESQRTGLARGSPGSYLQPEEVGEPLEDAGAQAADAVVGEVPAKRAEGTSGLGMPRCALSLRASPGCSLGGCTGTYRRFSSGRPRKAPGWTVLIRLFFRSLRGDRHRPQGVQRGAPSTGDTTPWGRGHESSPMPSQPPSPTRGFLSNPGRCKTPCKSLISSFPSHFPLVISPKGAGKARGSLPLAERGCQPLCTL